ncbi:hypothetical protein AAZX31_04G005100 [Glycine max]|uniref:Uncharacterized protein n=1 Tax=Glycine soja TaxID=3848 RepID=A0A445KU12_GLYSO|nr:hypothetical protein GLYMA_04G005451v4 [Glycine max]KAH1109161.1 hypothetical protein GYH30_008519 [Glycine max]RZC14359.1 hypothetical protein D0Y65_008376 [Glycine soja]
MERFYPKRRGSGLAEWKQGGSMGNVSAPPGHLLTIFGIVIGLLSFSRYKDYKAQLHTTAFSFQLFLFLLPVFFIFFIFSYSTTSRLNFHAFRP